MFETLVHWSTRSPVPLAHSHAGYSEGTPAGTNIYVFYNFLDPANTDTHTYIYIYIYIYIYMYISIHTGKYAQMSL